MLGRVRPKSRRGSPAVGGEEEREAELGVVLRGAGRAVVPESTSPVCLPWRRFRVAGLVPSACGAERCCPVVLTEDHVPACACSRRAPGLMLGCPAPRSSETADCGVPPCPARPVLAHACPHTAGRRAAGFRVRPFLGLRRRGRCVHLPHVLHAPRHEQLPRASGGWGLHYPIADADVRAARRSALGGLFSRLHSVPGSGSARA